MQCRYCAKLLRSRFEQLRAVSRVSGRFRALTGSLAFRSKLPDIARECPAIPTAPRKRLKASEAAQDCSERSRSASTVHNA
eukprot:15473572-Alexandrium_andersonii.AAC.1